MIGSRLGPYEITTKLGEGGMGEVYRAHDTKLRRDVAIKVLPAVFTEDEERLARFEREAQLLAQLNHPNIAAIYGVEESESTRALIMELVEGPTLAERLETGSMPLHEALLVARQIAEALEEAHEKGIIHRDLKPQNVKAPVEGKVKVLDFGLAKAMDPMGAASGGASASQLAASPTLTLGATVQGVILGTAAYMAPEQAAGGAADRRADIWSFGVVLFEMLSGRRLFEGETVSHVLAGVLKDEPDFSALPDGIPPRILRLLRRCLRKKPKQRLQSIGDARIVLDEVLAGAVDEIPAGTVAPAAPAARPAWKIALALAAAAGAGVLVALLLGGRPPAASPAPRVVSEIPLPPGTDLFAGAPALSPDGTRMALVLVSQESQKRMLWVRTLATGDTRSVPGTESALLPFWSPDGRSLGFRDSQSEQIKRVDLDGGRPVPIAKASTACGATWGREFIVFCAAPNEPLRRVSPSGGAVESATPGPNGERWAMPNFLPDGRQFVFIGRRSQSGSEDRLLLGSVDGATPRELLPADSAGRFDAGHLFYARGMTLLARPFDAARGKLRAGEPRLVAEGVATYYGGMFSVAAGLLVYAPGSAESGSRISIYDRSGKRIDEIDSDTFLDDLVLSRDGRRAAVMKSGHGESGDRNSDVWAVDLSRKLFSRATFGESDDDPVFSPDGKSIAFAHGGSLYRRPVDGAGDAKLLAEAKGDIVTNDWTGDGWIVYSDFVDGSEDLFAVRADGGEPKRLTATPFNERDAQVSPDGKWLAFATDEGGDLQVYVTTWPELGGRWRVSTETAAMPLWILGGRELAFLTARSRLMRAKIGARPANAGSDGAPEIGLAEEMFAVDSSSSYSARKIRWAAADDAERIYVLERMPDQKNEGPDLALVSNPLGGGGSGN